MVAAALMWSTGGIAVKLISLDAYQISSLRSAFAALIIFLIYPKRSLKLNKYSAMNAVFYVVVVLLFVVATKMTTAANAIFLQYTAPIYVLIFEPVFLKTNFDRVNLVTIVVCFAGMILFFIGDLSPGDLQGNILALISGVAFAGFFIGQRKNPPEYHISAIFYGNMLAALLTAHTVVGADAISMTDLGLSAYLGIFQLGLSYIIFSYGLARVQAIEGSLIAMIEPVLNPLWVLIGYGESPGFWAGVGGAVIITAVAFRTIVVDWYIYSRKRIALKKKSLTEDLKEKA